MKELVLIKLGGSVITDKSKAFTASKENIARLAKEIKESRKHFEGKIIVGHGGGSFAHIPAHKYQTKRGLINKNSLFGMAVTEDAARQLNMIVVKKFLEQKLPTFAFSPASFLISDASSYKKSYLDPIKKALEIGAIPVIYGDVILDLKTGCTIFSTETVLSILVKEMRREYKIRMIYCTDVDGVYDENGKTIEMITSKNFGQLKRSILGAKGVDVTGGMLHKVEESLSLAKKGIFSLIINGTKSGELYNALVGKSHGGTEIRLKRIVGCL